MLKKNQSIARANFSYIYRKGKRIRLKNADVLYLSNNQQYNQYAIVISTKIDKLATRRNWMRRQIKSWVFADNQTVNCGYQIVIIVKNNFYKNKHLALNIKKEILTLLNKL